MTNIDKLLNFLDEHDALHNFFAEFTGDFDTSLSAAVIRVCGYYPLAIYWAFDWEESIDGRDYWENLYDKAMEL